jgi:hypothetical protein
MATISYPHTDDMNAARWLATRGLPRVTALTLVSKAYDYDGSSQSANHGKFHYSVIYSAKNVQYTTSVRKMNAADVRLEAVIAMHARIINPETHLIDDPKWTVEAIAAEIRQLAPLGRSEKWLDNVEGYARFVESEGPDRIGYSYLQGSVYLSNAL